MNFRTLVKTGLVLGFSLSLVGCGTYSHHRHHGGACASAEDVAKQRPSKVAKARKQEQRITVAQKSQPAQKANAVKKVVTSTYEFGFDKDLLTPESKAELDKFAAFLAENPGTRVRIEGHTDEKGKETYNVGLGKRRAQTVANYLVDQGVAKDSIEVYSYGSQNPVDFGNTPQAHAKNRRVELFFEVDQRAAV